MPPNGAGTADDPVWQERRSRARAVVLASGERRFGFGLPNAIFFLDRPSVSKDIGHIKNAISRLIARSEEHTSELQSLMRISYAVFCLKKKKPNIFINNRINLNRLLATAFASNTSETVTFTRQNLISLF